MCIFDVTLGILPIQSICGWIAIMQSSLEFHPNLNLNVCWMSFQYFEGRWKIIMKKANVSLRHMVYIISTCIVLHNICTIENDRFNKKLIQEVEGREKVERWRATITKVNTKIHRGENVTQGKKSDIEIEVFSLRIMRKIKIYYTRPRRCMKA